jgi:uncharacterized protein YegL
LVILDIKEEIIMTNGERIEKAKQILREESDKNDYILFPQNINGVTYYNREQLEEDLIELRHFYLEQTK